MAWTVWPSSEERALAEVVVSVLIVLLAAAASGTVIVACTRTLAAVTTRLMSLGETPATRARFVLKAVASKEATVPLRRKEVRTTVLHAPPGGAGDGEGGGRGGPKYGGLGGGGEGPARFNDVDWTDSTCSTV